MNAGKILWRIPFGRMPIGPFKTPTAWGGPSMGGPMITRGGLVFIGASMDGDFRAYDLATGALVWKRRLPAPAIATPMSYQYGADNRQYVVIAAGGHGEFKTRLSDSLVAYTLK